MVQCKNYYGTMVRRPHTTSYGDMVLYHIEMITLFPQNGEISLLTFAYLLLDEPFWQWGSILFPVSVGCCIWTLCTVTPRTSNHARSPKNRPSNPLATLPPYFGFWHWSFSTFLTPLSTPTLGGYESTSNLLYLVISCYLYTVNKL